METEHETFVALRPCGCIVMAVVDDPAHAKDTAREVGKAIREGFKVQKVSTEWVRSQAHFRCSAAKAMTLFMHRNTGRAQLALGMGQEAAQDGQGCGEGTEAV